MITSPKLRLHKPEQRQKQEASDSWSGLQKQNSTDSNFLEFLFDNYSGLTKHDNAAISVPYHTCRTVQYEPGRVAAL